MNYSTTAVDWANFVREPMKYWVHVHMSQMRMSGTVEVDESLFGRRVKYHRGKFTENGVSQIRNALNVLV